MSQTLSLYRLQQVDNQIDRLQTRLKDIQKELDDDTQMKQLNEKVKSASSRCQVAEQALKESERNVQSQLVKIEQTQSDLYAAKSHSPKELQDLQNDVAALKRYLVTLEDRQIEAMQESETTEADLKIALVEFRTARDERTELTKGFQQDQEELNNELERFLVERNAIAGAIPTTELGLYDQLRQQRRGVAVAVISDNSCGACGSTLSLAQIQSARSSGQMMLCPSCGRILYGS
jgi:predicted  nucleic acid-binding Zn-ribbon protein